MNPWQSATTEVEPGHRGLQAVAVADPDPDVHQLAEVALAVASHRVVHVVPAPLVVASQEGPRIVLVRRHRDQDQLIVETTDAMTVRAPARRVPLAGETAEGWILVRTTIVLAVQLPVRVIPIVATVVAAMIVDVMIVPARATQIGQTVVAATIAVVMIVDVHLLPVPMNAMIAVATRVQAMIVRALRRRGEGRRIVVMIVHAVRLLVQRIVVMIAAGMIAPELPLHAQADLGRIGIVMSVHAHQRLARDIRIVVMSGVMTVLLAQRIAHLLDVRATLVKSVMIGVRALLCVVATMAIRSGIPGFLMTSRRRTLIAAC